MRVFSYIGIMVIIMVQLAIAQEAEPGALPEKFADCKTTEEKTKWLEANFGITGTATYDGTKLTASGGNLKFDSESAKSYSGELIVDKSTVVTDRTGAVYTISVGKSIKVEDGKIMSCIACDMDYNSCKNCGAGFKGSHISSADEIKFEHQADRMILRTGKPFTVNLPDGSPINVFPTGKDDNIELFYDGRIAYESTNKETPMLLKGVMGQDVLVSGSGLINSKDEILLLDKDSKLALSKPGFVVNEITKRTCVSVSKSGCGLVDYEGKDIDYIRLYKDKLNIMGKATDGYSMDVKASEYNLIDLLYTDSKSKLLKINAEPIRDGSYIKLSEYKSYKDETGKSVKGVIPVGTISYRGYEPNPWPDHSTGALVKSTAIQSQGEEHTIYFNADANGNYKPGSCTRCTICGEVGNLLSTAYDFWGEVGESSAEAAKEILHAAMNKEPRESFILNDVKDSYKIPYTIYVTTANQEGRIVYEQVKDASEIKIANLNPEYERYRFFMAGDSIDGTQKIYMADTNLNPPKITALVTNSNSIGLFADKDAGYLKKVTDPAVGTFYFHEVSKVSVSMQKSQADIPADPIDKLNAILDKSEPKLETYTLADYKMKLRPGAVEHKEALATFRKEIDPDVVAVFMVPRSGYADFYGVKKASNGMYVSAGFYPGQKSVSGQIELLGETPASIDIKPKG